MMKPTASKGKVMSNNLFSSERPASPESPSFERSFESRDSCDDRDSNDRER